MLVDSSFVDNIHNFPSWSIAIRLGARRLKWSARACMEEQLGDWFCNTHCPESHTRSWATHCPASLICYVSYVMHCSEIVCCARCHLVQHTCGALLQCYSSTKSSCWSWSSNTVTAKPSILWKVRKYLLFPGQKWDSPIHVRNMPWLALYQTEGKKYWLPILWRYYNFKATADADVRIKSLKRQLIFSICFITLASLAAKKNF